jgi:hypothetical protein
MSESDEIAQLKAQLAAERQRREAVEARNAERDAELLALRQRNAKLQELANGTFYSRLNEVWHFRSVVFTHAHFYALNRIRCPKVYRKTFHAAKVVTNVAVDQSSLSTSMDTGERNVVWPTDVFGRKNLSAHIAHLIPAASADAAVYDDVAFWALGLTPERVLERRPRFRFGLWFSQKKLWEAKQKAIHGARKRRGRKRISHTGLKHCQSNKIRLHSQREFLNNSPCVVIVPIMSQRQMKNWNGEGYEAIVMAEEWEDRPIKIVCQGIQMVDDSEAVATPEEIETARLLLETVLCGLAYSLVHRRRRFLKGESLDRFNRYREILVNSGVKVPSERAETRGEHVLRVFGRWHLVLSNVRKVRIFTLRRTHFFWQSKPLSYGRPVIVNSYCPVGK